MSVRVSGGPPPPAPAGPGIRGGGGLGVEPRRLPPLIPSFPPAKVSPSGRGAHAPGWRVGNYSNPHSTPDFRLGVLTRPKASLATARGGGWVGAFLFAPCPGQPSFLPPAGAPAPAAVTRCLTALRKRPGQPPASARRLRLRRLRATRLFPGSRAAGQLPLTAPGRPPAGGREEAGGAGGCVLPAGPAARREELPPPPPGATWRAPGRERQGSGGGLPGGFAAQGGRRALPRPASRPPPLPFSLPPARMPGSPTLSALPASGSSARSSGAALAFRLMSPLPPPLPPP